MILTFSEKVGELCKGNSTRWPNLNENIAPEFSAYFSLKRNMLTLIVSLMLCR